MLLKKLRRERRLTQAALAERAGISVRTVQLVESGRISPSLPTLAALRSVLGDGVLAMVTIFPGGEGSGDEAGAYAGDDGSDQL